LDIRGPTSKGREEEGREGMAREGEKREDLLLRRGGGEGVPKPKNQTSPMGREKTGLGSREEEVS